MAEMEVYLDESGTPPVSDEGEVFLVAAVAIEAPAVQTGTTESLTESETIQHLLASKGQPGYAYVLPTPGYGATLRQNMHERNRLGGISKAFDGANANFFPDDGLNTPNFIWSEAALNSAGFAMLGLAYRREVEFRRARVYFDQHSFTGEERHLARTIHERAAARS